MSAKNKLKRFAENATFPNVIQPTFNDVYQSSIPLKSNWNKEFFKNDNPIVLELGCGKGEYTVNLARKYPNKNFIGIDIKGARFWRGAKTAIEENLNNIGFVRTQIEYIESIFGSKEVSEIWITFPDPQLKERRAKKRLTAPGFLNKYKNIMLDNGIVNLKTDSAELHQYTKEVLQENNQPYIKATDDLYNSEYLNEELQIKTAYEKVFLKEGKKITYVCFHLDGVAEFK